MSRIASKIPGATKLMSVTRRLSRLLDNSHIRVREWYEPVARQWLAAQFKHQGEIRLIVDGTTISFRHQSLVVCLAYRKRAIPIAWTWVKHVKGHSTAWKHLALLAYVRKLLTVGAAAFLVGDNEFGPVEVLKRLDTGVDSMFHSPDARARNGSWFLLQSPCVGLPLLPYWKSSGQNKRPYL
jgi:hypothetical protein